MIGVRGYLLQLGSKRKRRWDRRVAHPIDMFLPGDTASLRVILADWNDVS